MRNTIQIATTIDESYVQHLGVMLCSLFESNPFNHLSIFVFSKRISSTQVRKLKKLAYRYDGDITIIEINESQIQNLKLNLHASVANYYRLLMADLLPNYLRKILYLDSDIIFKTDIGELWQTDVSEYYVAAVAEPFYDCSYLGFASEDKYFNSGVMLINLDKWRKEEIGETTINFIEQNPDKIKMWDQDGLNVVLKGKWLELPQQWNQTSRIFEQNPFTIPSIIHYTGSLKPWNYHCQHPLKSEYFHYLKKTPWRKFHFKEDTVWHKVKQSLKKSVNKVSGKKMFEIYA